MLLRVLVPVTDIARAPTSVAAMIRERPLLNTWRPPRDQVARYPIPGTDILSL